MKRFLVLVACAVLGPWLSMAQPVNVPPDTPTSNPDLPSIDVTEGYGAAKWGMSTADFEQAFPQAKLQRDVEEDLWAQRSASRIYSMGNESLKMHFEFLRGKLVMIVLETSINGTPYNGGSMVSRNLKSMEERISRQFTVQPSSGVSVRVTFPQRYGPQPIVVGGTAPLPGLPAAQAPLAVPAPAAPIVPRQRRPVSGLGGTQNITPKAGEAAAEPVVIRAAEVKPSPVEIHFSQSKLMETLEQEFTKEIAAAQNKAVGELLTKLAPPK